MEHFTACSRGAGFVCEMAIEHKCVSILVVSFCIYSDRPFSCRPPFPGRRVTKFQAITAKDAEADEIRRNKGVVMVSGILTVAIVAVARGEYKPRQVVHSDDEPG
jgi:hypothetical protein